MRLALRELVESLARHADPGWFPAGGVAAVARLPGAEAPSWRCAIVELRLAPDEARIDVMGARVAPPDDPALRALLPPEAWGALAGAGGPGVLVWAEWDRPGSGAPPLWSVGLAPSLAPDAPVPTQPPAERRRRALAATLGPDAGAWADPLEALVAALGDDGELLHLASLAPRGRRGLRVTVHLRAGALDRWLADLAWPGDRSEVRRVAGRLAPSWERIGVQVELLPGTGAYLGLESRTVRRRHGPTDHLAALFRDLPGLVPVDPRRLADLARWPGPAGDRVRHLYLKLVPGPGGWRAKAYVGATAVAPGSGSQARAQRRGSATP